MTWSKPAGVVAILVAALAVPSLAIVVAGVNPFAAARVLLGFTLGSYAGFTDVLVHAIPLTLLGLGVAVAFRGGIFNIGGDGQLIGGAVVAVAFVPAIAPLGSAGGIALFLVAGFVGGGALGALVGWLRARFGANEIIVTIMLNYVAVQLLTWVNRGPLQEPGHVFPRSYPIGPALELPMLLDGSRVHAGLLVALLAVAVVHLLMTRTSFGFRLTVLGENADAAAYAGIGRVSTAVAAMFVSGGLAGLAGATEIAGLHHRLEDGFADGFGLAAIAVALMARVNAIAVPFAAIFFGVFYVGAGALQREAQVPFPIVWIIEGMVIFAFLALAWNARRVVRAV